MFNKLSRLRRRPSASMVVATLALFVALSGGAYAAVIIPNNSVGFNQLKSNAVGFRDLATGSVGTRDLANNSVTYNKIAPGQIGHARVAQSQIQWRVTGTCAGEYAIQSIADTGKVTCAQSLPGNYSTAGLTEPLTSATTPVVLANETLPTASAYTVTANPYIEVQGSTGNQNVLVTCSLASGSATTTRSVSFALGANHEQQVNSIPLTLAVPTLTAAAPAAVACTTANDGTTGAAAPVVQASASISATQSVNTTETTAGTSTAPITLTTPTTTTTTASTPAPTS